MCRLIIGSGSKRYAVLPDSPRTLCTRLKPLPRVLPFSEEKNGPRPSRKCPFALETELNLTSQTFFCALGRKAHVPMTLQGRFIPNPAPRKNARFQFDSLENQGQRGRIQFAILRNLAVNTRNLFGGYSPKQLIGSAQILGASLLSICDREL